jgi:hypothetical protein
MGNKSYLCVTNAKTTYPSWVNQRFDLHRQTVACAAYSVPLLWAALFRPADIVRKTLTVEGEKVVTEAPLATLKKAIRQLDEAVPYLNRLFRREGPLDEYAGFLRQALEGLEYRYVTIELHEIAIMCNTLQEYYDIFRIALRGIGDDLSRAAWSRFKWHIAGFRKLKKFPPARLVLDGLESTADSDCANHSRILGDGAQSTGFGQPVPWEPG